MHSSPQDESHDSLDALLSAASHHSAGASFADRVIDTAYTEQQVDGSPQILRFLAPTLAAAAGIVITLFVTGNQDDSSMLTTKGAIPESAPEAEVAITELDTLSILLALDSSSDISLVEDDELDALLF